jgi:prepilin-type N-terminal cleavage/methylation domain-containing protein
VSLKRFRAFTLLELLVVIGIIAILLAAVLPAVNSLSKSSGRKGAISLLLGVFEQARALALKDGRATYVVFPAEAPAGTAATTDPNLLTRYFYHSVAIFEDDPDPTKPKIQVTEWKVLPTGVSLRTEISYTTSNSRWTAASFNFAPTQTTPAFPFLKFDASGGVESPVPPSVSGQPPNPPVQLNLFEGYVINGTFEKPTNPKNFTETISISRNSGRAVYATANP